MSDADVDLLIFFVIIGAAVAVCSALMWAIYRLIDKLQGLRKAKRIHSNRAELRRSLGKA